MIRPGRVAAAAVVAALAAALAWTGVLDHSPPRDPPGSVAPSAPPSVPVTVRSPSTVATRRADRPIVRTTAVERDVLTVVTEGLAAWGQFAVSGDLAHVAPWFDAGGPQFAQFEDEAGNLSIEPLGNPPYTVLLEDPVVDRIGADAAVVGRVIFVRTGEPSQSFHWRLVVREGIDGPKIWTVEALDYKVSNGLGVIGSRTAFPQN